MADELTPTEQQYFDTQGETPEVAAPAEPAVIEQAPDLVLEPELAPDLVLEPELAPEAEIAAEEQPDRDKRVPLAALHEARALAKERAATIEELKRARSEDERKWAVAQARMDTLAQLMTPRAQEQAVPSFDEDPVAASRYGIERTGQAVMSLAQQLNNMQQQQYETAQEHAFMQHAVAAENTLRQESPDYDHAVEFLVRQRAGELAALGFAQDQVMETLHAERKQLLQTAAQNRQNPAKMLYDVAKARGYQTRAPAGEQQMERLQAGARASQGVASVTGRQSVPISIQTLATMDEADFYKISSNEKAWRKLFGE
jgi:hypothetical protein